MDGGMKESASICSPKRIDGQTEARTYLTQATDLDLIPSGPSSTASSNISFIFSVHALRSGTPRAYDQGGPEPYILKSESQMLMIATAI